MRSKEQQLHLQLTTIAQHYLPPQQKRGVGWLVCQRGSGSSTTTTNPLQQDTHMTPSHMSPERFAELDANGGTLTPAEQAAGWHYCPEFDFMLTMGEGPGPCPCGIHGDSPLQLTRPEPHGTRDPLELVVYNPNEPVSHMTDEEVTAHLAEGIKCKAEADAYDKNLAQEMKAALDSLTEEDLIRPQDPDLVDAVYEPTYAEHVDLIAKAKEYLATVKAIVHQHEGQWYFWEETYSQRIGPYSTEIAANKALDHYCDVVLGQGREPA